MKKLIKFILILAVIGLIGYVGYRYYLPSLIAETLLSDEPSSLVPAEMQEKVEKVKLKIDKEIEKLPAFMKENKIEYEDLQVMIDRADPDQFISAYNEIATTRITSTNQVFDIGMKYIRISGYDLEIFRTAFVKNTSVEDIKKAITKPPHKCACNNCYMGNNLERVMAFWWINVLYARISCLCCTLPL